MCEGASKQTPDSKNYIAPGPRLPVPGSATSHHVISISNKNVDYCTLSIINEV